MALDFVGAVAIEALSGEVYDVVSKSMDTTAMHYKPFLVDLKVTIQCLQPRLIQQIEDHNVELDLKDDELQSLQRQMEEVRELVRNLPKARTWNRYIWCTKPCYPNQIVELDHSLRELLNRLKCQENRVDNEDSLLAKKTAVKLDELKKQQLERDVGVEIPPGNTVMEKHERIEGNGVQQAALAEAFEVLRLAVMLVQRSVIQAQDKTEMFKRILIYLEYTLANLKQFWTRLPNEQLKNLQIEMEKGIELVRSCSAVHSQNKRYEYADKLSRLDVYFQRLLYEPRKQYARETREGWDLIIKIEKKMKGC